MLQQLSHGWTADVDRGPEWLFVRPHWRHLDQEPPAPEADESEIADSVWRLMQTHFIHRLVLELDELPLLHSSLIGELVKLHKRITSQGGIIRLCGVNDSNQNVLRICRLDQRFPQYQTREQAVMGYRPRQAR